MATPKLRLPPLPTVRDLVKLYKISARKQLSQNFLMEEGLTAKIIKQAGKLENKHVIEIGPGPGGLTRSILHKRPKKVILVEKDRRFGPTLEMLSEAFAMVGGKTDIVYDDVVRTKFEKMIDEDVKRAWEDTCPDLTIIGNLPFNVSTHLIIKWLRSISERSGPWSFGRTPMLLTFQKEVAERLVAPINHPQRCRLSVMAQAWTNPRLRLLIPGTAFVPRPKVDVGVVSFLPLVQPNTTHNFDLFEKVTRHLFSFRRKYSIKGIGTLFPKDRREELSSMMFKLSDVNPQSPSYDLTVEEVHRLCSAYKYLLNKHPDIAHYEYRASRKIISVKYLGNVNVEEVDELDEDEAENENEKLNNEEKIDLPKVELVSGAVYEKFQR